MTPGSLLRVIKSGQLSAALRTAPSRRIVLQPQVNALLVRLQLDSRDVPRRGNRQNRLEQLRVLQRRRSLWERMYQQDTSTPTRRRAGRPLPGAVHYHQSLGTRRSNVTSVTALEVQAGNMIVTPKSC